MLDFVCPMEERRKALPIQVAVRAILLNDEEKIMLVKRAAGCFEEGKWCLVGGKPNQGEDLPTALTREIKEEVGTEYPLRYYAEIENPDTSTGARWITHYFVAKVNNLPTNLDQSEVAEVGFFTQGEIAGLNVAFDHKEVLAQFFQEKSHIKKFLT